MSISSHKVGDIVNDCRPPLTELDSSSGLDEAYQTIAALSSESTKLLFNDSITSDLEILCTEFAAWMSTDSTAPASTSRVGILSSTQCQRLLYTYRGDDLCTNLALLVKISSLLYKRENAAHPHYTYRQLSSARDVLGKTLLARLQQALRPLSLSKNSREQHEVLFIIILGVVISVAYTHRSNSEDARNTLLRILTHYLVIIGERVNLLQFDTTKARLVQRSQSLWDKSANFRWDYQVETALIDDHDDMGCLEAMAACGSLTSPVPEHHNRRISLSEGSCTSISPGPTEIGSPIEATIMSNDPSPILGINSEASVADNRPSTARELATKARVKRTSRSAIHGILTKAGKAGKACSTKIKDLRRGREDSTRSQSHGSEFPILCCFCSSPRVMPSLLCIYCHPQRAERALV